jgi:excisionase family DNA binding protein
MTVAILPGVFTISEAAERARVSETTLRKQIAAGNIRTRRIAGCVRILDDELDRFLRAYEANAS